MAKKKQEDEQVDALLTMPQVAEYLAVSERTIYNWAYQGTIPSFKLGELWRFRKTDLNAWIEERREQTPRPMAE